MLSLGKGVACPTRLHLLSKALLAVTRLRSVVREGTSVVFGFAAERFERRVCGESALRSALATSLAATAGCGNVVGALQDVVDLRVVDLPVINMAARSSERNHGLSRLSLLTVTFDWRFSTSGV